MLTARVVVVLVVICGVLFNGVDSFDPNEQWTFQNFEDVVGAIGTVYHAVGGDFDNDGYDDIVW